jgi:trehalose-6-phosphate synthase
MKLINNEEIAEDLFNKEKDENIVIDREYKNKYNKYINDVLWWLEENGYMKYE